MRLPADTLFLPCFAQTTGELTEMVRLLLITVCVCGTLRNDAVAQTAVQRLLQNYVDPVDDRYSDVADAVVLFQRNNRSAALQLLQKAAGEHPKLPPAEVLFAHLCFGSGQAAAGHAALESATVRHPQDPEPWIMLADLAMNNGRLAEADVLFRHGLDRTDGLKQNRRRGKWLQTNAVAGLARVSENRGLLSESESWYRRWQELQPENIAVLRALAGVCFRQKKIDDTKELLIQAQKIDSAQLPPDVVLGLFWQKTGNSEEAEKSMRSALKAAPDDSTTRLAVAEWAVTCGRTDLAEQNADHVLKKDPKSGRARMIRGHVLRFQGRHADAEKIFEQLLKEAPAGFSAGNQLALALLAQDGKERHRRALQYARVNADRYKDLKTAAGRTAAATLARGLYLTGQNDAAAALIQKAVSTGEVHPQTGYFAAQIFHSVGQTDAARAVLEKSLASYIAFPEQKEAAELLQDIGPAEESEPSKDAESKP